jgi:hypothetical protein
METVQSINRCLLLPNELAVPITTEMVSQFRESLAQCRRLCKMPQLKEICETMVRDTEITSIVKSDVSEEKKAAQLKILKRRVTENTPSESVIFQTLFPRSYIHAGISSCSLNHEIPAHSMALKHWQILEKVHSCISAYKQEFPLGEQQTVESAVVEHHCYQKYSQLDKAWKFDASKFITPADEIN